MRRLIGAGLMLLLIVPVMAQQPPAPAPVTPLIPEIMNTIPHDDEAFTQGLLLFDGDLYESTGLRGESTLRRVSTLDGEVLQSIDVPEEFFAEGLEIVDDRLIQLTWQSGQAFVYDAESFEQLETYDYEGEGWGLCYDGRYLFMSDSTQYLQVREADDFDLVVKFLVTLNGQAIQPQLLNELECVGDFIYANLWQTNFIVQIDKFTGNVTGVIDATNLFEAVNADGSLTSGQVLNGIAYNPANDTFFVTGKQWSMMFEVRFVEAPVEG